MLQNLQCCNQFLCQSGNHNRPLPAEEMFPKQHIKEGSNVPRKGHTQKRDVLVDPIYNNKVVTKLINNIMLDGKKGVAQKIVYGAFNRVAETTGKDAVEVFEEAMNNIMPVLEGYRDRPTAKERDIAQYPADTPADGVHSMI